MNIPDSVNSENNSVSLSRQDEHQPLRDLEIPFAVIVCIPLIFNHTYDSAQSISVS